MRASVERIEDNAVHIGHNCHNCEEVARSRRREFSEQAWSVLLAWGEVDGRVVDQPICDDCYNELREILIDRAEEMTNAISNPDDLAARVAAAAARPIVRAKKKKAAPMMVAKKKAAAKSVVAKSVTGKKKSRRVA